MTAARHALLWGGPEDGAAVHLPAGDTPPRVGVHRTPDGALVPIRGRALTLEEPGEHIDVYERATVGMLRRWPVSLRRRWLNAEPEVVLYIHGALVTRWTAQP